ncbi:MAG: response regulator [Bacteroidetes bacterium]|nr:MAG: response regulator [Bacteroidota bacterium]
MAQTICVIEDDESIQDVLRIILKRAGYETTIFPDGSAIFENNYGTPDLFLIDKQLPGADGLTICSYLKNSKRTKEIPVVMMSAYPNVEQLSILAGANGFIEKPFEVKTLVSTIQTHVQNHHSKRIHA